MVAAMTTTQGKPSVPAVTRAARVLDVVSVSPGGMTGSEIARAIGAPKSSWPARCTTRVAPGPPARAALARGAGGGGPRGGWTAPAPAPASLAQSALTSEFRRVDAE